MPGPLHAVRVLDFTGLGPGPFCAGLLGDLGADVIRIERAAPRRFTEPEKFIPHRSRRSIVIDLSTAEGVGIALRLIDHADVLIEGNRPGVMERLGLGPELCLARNRRLIYGRLTGWGQDGPLAYQVGHDINYISVVGALGLFRRHDERPMFPLNLVADYGGGGMLMAFGIACALFERDVSGLGQVIDAAMTDGVAVQLGVVHAFRAMGRWHASGTNSNDSGAHYYELYETADGRYLAVGAIEAKFYSNLLAGLGLAGRDLPSQDDRASWPEMKLLFAETIATRTLEEWCEVFDGVEACVSPVLEIGEAVDHPHNRERGTYVELDGVVQPGVAPRFSRTPGRIGWPAPAPGQHSDEVLTEIGLDPAEIGALRDARVVC